MDDSFNPMHPLHSTWISSECYHDMFHPEDIFATETHCNYCQRLDATTCTAHHDERLRQIILPVNEYRPTEDQSEYHNLLSAFGHDHIPSHAQDYSPHTAIYNSPPPIDPNDVHPPSYCNMNGANPFDSLPTFDTNTVPLPPTAHQLPPPPIIYSPPRSSRSSNPDTKKRKTSKKRHRKRVKPRSSSIDSLDDDFFVSPTPARTGDTDKMWIYCTHKQYHNSDKDCGVHFVRTLKYNPFSVQHYCLCDINHKMVTRTLGHLFKNCKYCEANGVNCVRAATLHEIEQYQAQCKALNVMPNHKFGGFKAMKPPNVKQMVKNEEEEDDDLIILNPKRTSCKRPMSGNDSDSCGLEDGCNTTEPVQHCMVRRSQKRMREDGDVSTDQPLKKARLETAQRKRDELETCDLNMLLAKALECDPSLRWIWNDKSRWCRYCGSRVSFAWHSCVWGKDKLCTKHYEECQSGLIDLKLYQNVEPMTLNEVINPSDCQEREFLIDLIIKHQS
eukprot:88972_1